MTNEMKRLWGEGKPIVNGWLSIPSSFAAEIVAAQGFDAITIDLQHGLIDQQSMVTMLQAMRASGATPLVRVPSLDAAAIMKALDAGALGVICPMVNTREQAEALVSYVRYPPTGIRSFGPTRALISVGADYARRADGEVMCFAMIETREGYDNLEEIAGTPGLDGILVGPSDLALGLGDGKLQPGLDREEPEMIEAFQRIVSVSRAAGIKTLFICATPAYAARAAEWGYDAMTVSNDIRYLAGAAQAAVSETRRLIGR